jgi:hypothetical protein
VVELRVRGFYKLFARNLLYGVYVEYEEYGAAFIGIREKFNQLRLDVEYLAEKGKHQGLRTSHAESDVLAMLPESIELRTHGPSQCSRCGALVNFDITREPPNERWQHNEPTTCTAKLSAVSYQNRALFKWLQEMERYFRRRERRAKARGGV